MSYQVLARKWRPGKFSELVGQEHVVSAISNALDNDRLHHAYLFTGTRGVGKTTIARIFSKSLNCEEGQGANPCGQCNTCKEIEQGNYVDLLEIDAASRTKVEDTRELLDNVQYKPTRGRYKVYLIDEVHMLSKHSFNALLKTLEEPPPHVKFLLATTDPQKLPITILSRCLQFNLKAMSREQIVGQLTHILQQENLPFEPQALSLLARAAQGSMRDALSLTDQAIAQGGNNVVASVVTDMLGLMDKNQLLKVIHAVVNKQPADVMQLVTEIAEQAPDYSNVHSELASLLHQIALTQWVPEACKLETTSAKAIYQLAKGIPAEQVQLLYQIALQGKKDFPFAADGKSAFEMTLMRMMTFAPAVPLSDTQSAIETHQSKQTLPVNSYDPSGGPGNVSKQEEAHSSETLANHNTESDISAQTSISEVQHTNVHGNSTASAADDSDSSVVGHNVDNNNTPTTTEISAADSSHRASEPSLTQKPNEQGTIAQGDCAPGNCAQGTYAEDNSAEDNSFVSSDITSEPSANPAADNVMPHDQTPNNEALPHDGPPLDAYMDDMLSHYEGDQNDHSLSFGAHGESNDNDNTSFQHEAQIDRAHASNNEPEQTPEEQLTSTADMLALRQKLKQRKAEEADSKSAATASEKSESAEQIQARFVKAGASAASSAVVQHSETKTEEQQAASDSTTNPIGNSSSIDSASAQGDGDTQPSDLQYGASHTPDTAEQPAVLQPNEGSAGLNNSVNAELNEFDSEEFDADIPFASDEVQHQATPTEENTHSGEHHFDATHAEHMHEQSIVHPEVDASLDSGDTPPWAMDDPVSSPANTDERGFEHSEVQAFNNSTESNTISENSGWEGLEFDAPLSDTYNGSLNAYLDNGNKLTHASQIDSWSNLVEQMPVAGLLKQLVLHAAFSKNENTVNLEIHHSQAHLLNDNTKAQLIDALRQGMGENVEVVINLGEPASTPFSLQQEIHAMRHAHAHTVIKTDDTIQALLSTFDASVLTETVKARQQIY